jgi:putative two-component system response regulator
MANELILIVEDMDLLREGLREILANEGYRVITARHGREALDQMNTSLPDLIISDITMPVMDGIDFYSAVRARKDWIGVPFIVLSARSEPADFMVGRNLGVDDYLVKPVSRDELVTTVRSRLGRFQQAQMARVQQAYLDSLVAMANAIEARTPESNQHIEHITGYASLIAGYLGWTGKRLVTLRFAAILHDIGKIHVPASVLFKPGPLDPAEWELVRRHPLTGAEMIKDVPFLLECVPIVRHHHERWDGQGYPDGLAGAQIPEGARLLCVADSLDSMTTQRRYAPACTFAEAIATITALAGAQFDPQIVAALQQAWQDGRLQAIRSQGWQVSG